MHALQLSVQTFSGKNKHAVQPDSINATASHLAHSVRNFAQQCAYLGRFTGGVGTQVKVMSEYEIKLLTWHAAKKGKLNSQVLEKSSSNYCWRKVHSCTLLSAPNPIK